jgi:hypothetical protein
MRALWLLFRRWLWRRAQDAADRQERRYRAARDKGLGS